MYTHVAEINGNREWALPLRGGPSTAPFSAGVVKQEIKKACILSRSAKHSATLQSTTLKYSTFVLYLLYRWSFFFMNLCNELSNADVQMWMQLYCHITNSSKRQKQFDYRYAHTLIHTGYWAQIGDYRYCTRKLENTVQTEYRPSTERSQWN